MVHVKKNFSILAPDLLRGAGLILVSALVWCTIMHRWSVDAWRTPLEYTANPERSGDALCYFAEVKAALDGRYRPLLEKKIPELGAPLGANWSDYPTTEQVIIFATGLIAPCLGIFAACNFMTMLAQVLGALSMYAVCRVLRCHWSWAFAAGIAYGFVPYAFAHSEHHLDLTFYWHVPLCLLVTRWLSTGEGLTMRGARFLFALAVAFVTGLQNQYYTFMFIQLAILGGLAQWIHRGWRAVLPSLSICGASLFGFVFVSLDAILSRLLHGYNPDAVLRNYSQMEFYALKVIDLFIPVPGHRLFPALAEHYSKIVLVRGEVPPAGYLGLVGIAGFIALGVTTFVSLARRRPSISLEAAQTFWIVLQAGVGGLNAFLGLLGFYLFRVTERYSIFILALSLLFLVRGLSRLTRDKPILSAIGAVTLGLIALIDQTPPLTTNREVEQTASTVNSDRKFTEEVESRLQPGAMVFQLPIVDFPEAFPGACYTHFRPYLFSHHLRFSFGSVKGRGGHEWVQSLNTIPANDAIAILKSHGFDAIYVDRTQFQDQGNQLFNGFAKMGMDVVQSQRSDLFCVFLKKP
jgi:hypothetical protein